LELENTWWGLKNAWLRAFGAQKRWLGVQNTSMGVDNASLSGFGVCNRWLRLENALIGGFGGQNG